MADDDKDKIKKAQIELEKKLVENAVDEYKEKIKEQRRASRAAELENYMKEKIDYRDEKGNPVTNWDTFWRKNKESLGHSSFTSNYDWRTFMMMLLGDLSLMVTAMHGSIKTSEKRHGMRMLWDHYCPVLFGVPSTKDFPLPNLEYGVRVTDAAGGYKLVIDPLIRSEKEDVLTQIENSREPDLQKKAEKLRAAKEALDNLNNHFKEPVIAWLAKRGYTLNPAEPDQYINKNREVLTPEAFAALNEPKNDKENEPTLNEFLGQNTEVSLTPRPF